MQTEASSSFAQTLAAAEVMSQTVPSSGTLTTPRAQSPSPFCPQGPLNNVWLFRAMDKLKQEFTAPVLDQAVATVHVIETRKA